jgi:hypothetical protein
LEKEHGLRVIGNGSFGIVCSKPDWDFVIKLWPTDSDGGYDEFIKYVNAYPNKHYPKIVRKKITLPAFFKRDKMFGTHFSVIKLEKLKLLDKNIAKCVVEILRKGSEMSIINAAKGKDTGENKEYPPYRLFPDGTSRKALAIDLIKEFPQLPDLCQAWLDLYTKSDLHYSLDAHIGNFMQRSDGTIVIIDPFWSAPNIYAQADAQWKIETDYYGDYEPTMVTGPYYLQKQKKEVEKVVKELTFDELDDTPF